MTGPRTRSLTLLFLAAVCAPAAAGGGDAGPLVAVGPGGKLVYGRDPDGNRICDFSWAGYRGGGVAIPDVPPVYVLGPKKGDDTRRIQEAIDRVSRMPVRYGGFRGALLLRKGRYEVTDTLEIRRSGIVIRGAGAGFGGTWIYHRRSPKIADPTPGRWVHTIQPEKGIIPTFHTRGGRVKTRKVADVTQDLAAAGTARLAVSDISGIRPGAEIVIVCRQTRKWIAALGLTKHWKSPFVLRFPRVVAAVHRGDGTIVLNVPLTSRIDRAGGYAEAAVHAVVRDDRLRNVGLEDILFLSGYDRSRKDDKGYFNDENHPNYVFRFYGARDGWIRRCAAFFYSGGMVATGGSQHLTVEDCAMLDGVSRDTPAHHAGSRKYYFNANGDMILFQRCYARYARHSFIGNGTCGGVVFLDCLSERDHLKSEWHQRWGHGHLFDNLCCEAQIGLSGTDSSHGQKAAFAVAWNNLINNRRAYENDLIINRLPGLFRNYAFGNVLRGSGGVGTDVQPGRHGAIGAVGLVASPNRFTVPRSLYLAQLRERRDAKAVRAVATVKQINGGRGAVWKDLATTFSRFPEWADPERAPWKGFENRVPAFDPPVEKAAAARTAGGGP